MDEKEKYKQIIDEFKETTLTQSIKLTTERRQVGVFSSKFGGKPYMPKEFEYPCDDDGKPLRLLAQLNFAELPKIEHFPKQGILQFYIGEDECYGVDFDNPTNQNTFRIIYHDNILSNDLISDDLPQLLEEDFPFEGEFALIAEEQPLSMTSCDFRFNDEFLKTYKKYINTNKTSFFDLDLDDEIAEAAEAIYNDLALSGHRIGGYPYFTQADPREYNKNLQKYNIMLLQIDSEGDGQDEIIWGDCGVANFFISLEDLIDCNFTNVLYTWDCC